MKASVVIGLLDKLPLGLYVIKAKDKENLKSPDIGHLRGFAKEIKAKYRRDQRLSIEDITKLVQHVINYVTHLRHTAFCFTVDAYNQSNVAVMDLCRALSRNQHAVDCLNQYRHNMRLTLLEPQHVKQIHFMFPFVETYFMLSTGEELTAENVVDSSTVLVNDGKTLLTLEDLNIHFATTGWFTLPHDSCQFLSDEELARIFSMNEELSDRYISLAGEVTKKYSQYPHYQTILNCLLEITTAAKQHKDIGIFFAAIDDLVIKHGENYRDLIYSLSVGKNKTLREALANKDCMPEMFSNLTRTVRNILRAADILCLAKRMDEQACYQPCRAISLQRR